MANNNVASGLRPIMTNATPYNGQLKLGYVPSSQATAIFLGDPLVYLGGSDANGVPAMGLATAGAGNALAGSMNGVVNGPALGATAASPITQNSTVYHPASTVGYIMYWDGSEGLFEIQEDSVGGAIAAATGSGANGNLVSGVGSTVTGFSGWMLQSSSVAASANTTYQLRLLGLVRGPDNAIGNYAKWIVRMNNPQFQGNTGV